MEGAAAAATAKLSPGGAITAKRKSSLRLPGEGELPLVRSASYRDKLPSLSPRSMKLFDEGISSSQLTSGGGGGGGGDELTVDYRGHGQSTYEEETLSSNSSSSATSTDSGCPNAVAVVQGAKAAAEEDKTESAEDTRSHVSHEDDIVS